MGNKKFILNADDFGISNDINRAIVEGYNAEILHSTSLCANGDAFYSATNEIMPPEAQSLFNSSYQVNVTPVRNEPLLYFGDYGTWSTTGWHMMSNYLATINNLDTPVTKTADKTMKITYILQEQ